MISRKDRIIATLIVWVFFGMILVWLVQFFLSPPISTWGIWYGYQSIIAQDAAQANQAIEALSNFNNGLYSQIQTYGQTVAATYLPWVLAIAAALMAAVGAATYFIWRSVIIPDITPVIDEKEKRQTRTRRAQANPAEALIELPVADETLIDDTTQAETNGRIRA